MSAEKRDPSKFRIVPLTTESYNSWSNEMEIVLRDKGLWKFVEKETPRLVETLRGASFPKVEHKEHLTDAAICEADEQKEDLELAYFLT